jgi:hypothetical protein
MNSRQVKNMKFSKVFVGVCLLALLLTFAGVYAQTSITTITSPTTSTLNSVFVVNNVTSTSAALASLNAWAVGDGGTIAFWTGSNWTKVNSPTTMNLYSIFFVNASSGWAVGGSSVNGVILNYNGSAWNLWTKVSYSGNATGKDMINATLYSVVLDVTGGVGWIVGANGTTLGYNGAAWFGVQANTTNTLRSVSMTHNGTEAWAVGEKGMILRWNNSSWVNVTSPTTMNLFTIQMLNTTAGWAGGGVTNNGTILMMNGSTWSNWTKISLGGMATVNTTASDTLNATIYSMSFNNASSGWAVGGKGTVLYWSGIEWDGQTNVANADLRGVSMVHGNFSAIGQAWAVGDSGTIIAWTGTTWIPEIPVFAVPLLLGLGLAALVLGKAKLYRKKTM